MAQAQGLLERYINSKRGTEKTSLRKEIAAESIEESKKTEKICKLTSVLGGLATTTSGVLIVNQISKTFDQSQPVAVRVVDGLFAIPVVASTILGADLLYEGVNFSRLAVNRQEAINEKL